MVASGILFRVRPLLALRCFWPGFDLRLELLVCLGLDRLAYLGFGCLRLGRLRLGYLGLSGVGLERLRLCLGLRWSWLRAGPPPAARRWSRRSPRPGAARDATSPTCRGRSRGGWPLAAQRSRGRRRRWRRRRESAGLAGACAGAVGGAASFGGATGRGASTWVGVGTRGAVMAGGRVRGMLVSREYIQANATPAADAMATTRNAVRPAPAGACRSRPRCSGTRARGTDRRA